MVNRYQFQFFMNSPKYRQSQPNKIIILAIEIECAGIRKSKWTKKKQRNLKNLKWNKLWAHLHFNNDHKSNTIKIIHQIEPQVKALWCTIFDICAILMVYFQWLDHFLSFQNNRNHKHFIFHSKSTILLHKIKTVLYVFISHLFCFCFSLNPLFFT